MKTATYSPEDNKLRLYATARLPREVYDRVRAAGFIWAPRQGLFVAPMWTPEREDLLTELCGEVGDEDTSLVERAEERADRFEEYSENRGADAERAHAAVGAIADGIPLGQPILVGHHSERHARRDAERIESGMRKAVRLWETARYWTDRAAGAIRHAKYRELPAVRARRIKTLEAEKRKHERTRDEATRFLRAWRAAGLTWERARAIANHDHVSRCYPLAEFPRLTAEASTYEGQMSLWSALDGIITPAQARRIACRCHVRTIRRARRWVAHLDNRLAYERAMLAEAGGTAADRVKPEKGGACRCWCSPGHGRGWSIIQKVNRVSVTLLDNWGNGGRDFTRTVPFDNLKAVMSKADVDTRRAAGLLVDSDGGRGFFLADEPPPAPREKPAADPRAERFEALAETLAAGVRVVSAPQLFPTPPEVARRVVALAEIGPGMRVLEPSAGTGNLLAAIGSGPDVVAVEINPQLAEALARCGVAGVTVRQGDFLEMKGELGEFDRVVMNPPFDHGADIKHVEHALAKLKKGGRLVAVVANGPRQRERLLPIASAWIDLPAGSFREQGTNVNAAIVVIET
jgi:protein-L-isoaspartate O-methyltransferase